VVFLLQVLDGFHIGEVVVIGALEPTSEVVVGGRLTRSLCECLAFLSDHTHLTRQLRIKKLRLSTLARESA
jgi:hypothetical protein